MSVFDVLRLTRTLLTGLSSDGLGDPQAARVG
jgi:hypothetical protein